MTWKTIGVYDTPVTREIYSEINNLHASLLSSGQIGESPLNDEKHIVNGNIEYTRYWLNEEDADTWIQNMQATLPDISITFQKIQVD